MNIKIQSVHFDADKKLLEFVQEKVGKLNHYHDKIVNSDVILRLEKSGTMENKVAEIKCHVPGMELFAKKQSKSFEASTDSALEALRNQIKKHKMKHR